MKNPGLVTVKAAQVAEGFATAGTVEEGGENRGDQVERFLASVGLGPGNPWCAAFVRHCEEKGAAFTGASLPAGFPDSGYCPDFKNWAIQNNLWIPVGTARLNAIVQRGDLAVFYFAAKRRVAHIEIVTGTMVGGVTTVGGNTGPEVGEVVNREGDGVYRKRRHWSELGTLGGFVRVPDGVSK